MKITDSGYICYFEFQGKQYATGTVVELSDMFYKSRGFGEYIKGIPVKFLYRTHSAPHILIFSVKNKCCINIHDVELAMYVKNIVYEIPYVKKSRYKIAKENWKNKDGKPDTSNGWIWYVFGMAVFFFAKNGFILMIFITLMFIDYLINKYNY